MVADGIWQKLWCLYVSQIHMIEETERGCNPNENWTIHKFSIDESEAGEVA